MSAFLPDQPEADLAPLHLRHHRHAVADGGADPDVRVLLAEDRQQGREEMFAGDGTGGEEQFPGDRGLVAGDLPPGLPVEVEDPLGVVVELPARLGEQHPTAPPLEQGACRATFRGPGCAG